MVSCSTILFFFRSLASLFYVVLKWFIWRWHFLLKMVMLCSSFTHAFIIVVLFLLIVSVESGSLNQLRLPPFILTPLTRFSLNHLLQQFLLPLLLTLQLRFVLLSLVSCWVFSLLFSYSQFCWFSFFGVCVAPFFLFCFAPFSFSLRVWFFRVVRRTKIWWVHALCSSHVFQLMKFFVFRVRIETPY